MDKKSKKKKDLDITNEKELNSYLFDEDNEEAENESGEESEEFNEDLELNEPDEDIDIIKNNKDLQDLLEEISNNGSEEYINILHTYFTNKKSYEFNKTLLLNMIDKIIETILDQLKNTFDVYNKDDSNSEIINKLLSLFKFFSLDSEIVLKIKDKNISKILVVFFNYLQLDNESKISKQNLNFLGEMNNIVLNFLQNAKMNNIILILLSLGKDYKKDSNISYLASNCLVQISKKNLNIQQNELNLKFIFKEMLYILRIDKKEESANKEEEKRTQTFHLTIQKLLYNICKSNIRKEIVESYKNCINENNLNYDDENYFLEWICKIYDKLNKTNNNNSNENNKANAPRMDNLSKLKRLKAANKNK